MEMQRITENDVLIGTALWLHENNWRIKQISMASGQNIDLVAHKQKVVTRFTQAGLKVDEIMFRSNGPDIEATKGSHIIKIECKGLGNVRIQTVKNNFDRAVASAVSYYDVKKEPNLQIALALPEYYLKLMKNKLSQSLREAISLWIFLYAAIDEVLVFMPTETLPD